MTDDHIAQLAAYARRRSEHAQRRARQALAVLADSGQDVTVAALAKNAAVSRSWIYTQPDLLDQIEELRHASARATKPSPTAGRASLESLNRRLELAHQRIAQLREENQQLRRSVEQLHGQLRVHRHHDNSPSTTPVHDTKPQQDSQIRPPR